MSTPTVKSVRMTSVGRHQDTRVTLPEDGREANISRILYFSSLLYVPLYKNVIFKFLHSKKS